MHELNERKYTHSVTHVDGTHTKVFPNRWRALEAMARSLGYDEDDGNQLRPDRDYIDSNGGRHIVEHLPYGINNARQADALREAYDARECGTATKRQLAMLERLFF